MLCIAFLAFLTHSYECNTLTDGVILVGDGSLNPDDVSNCLSGNEKITIKGFNSLDIGSLQGFQFKNFYFEDCAITSIPDYYFKECKLLLEIEIPNTVNSIGVDAFRDCTSLESFILTSNEVSMDVNAIKGCSNIRVLCINCVITDVDYSDCKKTLELFEYPRSVKRIPDNDLEYKDWEGWETKLHTIKIPSTTEEIGEYAFQHCYKLTTFEIIDEKNTQLRVICSSAFAFTNLTYFISSDVQHENITIPDSLEEIQEYAFDHCENIKYIFIPNTLKIIHTSSLYGVIWETVIFSPDFDENILNNFHDYNTIVTKNLIMPKYSSMLVDIGFLYFFIEYIELPENIEAIPDGYFEYCKLLKNIIIPEKVTYIGSSAFYQCENLTSMIIPEGVTTIKEGTFEYCSKLSYIEISSKTTNIERRAFVLTNLTTFTVPSSVTYIGEYAFSLVPIQEMIFENFSVDLCSSIDFENMPISTLILYNVESIDGFLLSNCKTLTNIIIPNATFQKVPDYFLCDCENYETFIIPSSVKEIGEYAFANCSKLQIIFEEGSTLISIGNCSFYSSGIINFKIPSSVTSIGESAFQNCFDLVYFEVGNSIDYLPDFSNHPNLETFVFSLATTEIPIYHFRNCTHLRSVLNANNVTIIGHRAFINCTSLLNISFPSCEKIEINTFEGCISLSQINLSSCKEIDEDAFEGCISLLQISLPRCEEVYKNAFEGCISLSYLSLPSCYIIHENAFHGCNELSEIDLPTCCYIYTKAFYECIKLSKINLPDNVFIYESAFQGCISITNLYLPGYDTIYESAFEGCTGLLEINLNSTESYEIGNRAFYGCTNLRIIKCCPRRICEEAFYNCNNLQTLIILENIEIIYYDAFYGCYQLSDFQFYGTSNVNCLDESLASLPSLHNVRIMNESYKDDNFAGLPIVREASNTPDLPNDIPKLPNRNGLGVASIIGIVVSVIVVAIPFIAICIYVYIIKPKHATNEVQV